MMRKRFRIFLLISIILSSIFFINTGIKTTAEECNDCNQIATSPGDADHSRMNCDCSGDIPTIIASSDEVAPGESITLYVDSGDLACPPYKWSVSDAAYSINSQSNKDLETVTLSASSGSCGDLYGDENINCTVTVIDACGAEDSISIKNTAEAPYTRLIETCGAMDGWHQTTCYEDGFKYIVDHYNCNRPDTKHGTKCSDHPCCGCSSYYCEEGSEKWGWGCP